MKRESKSRDLNFELYKYIDERDSRCYGLFYDTKESVKIDTKRYSQEVEALNESQKKIVKNRNTHYFYPKKYNKNDYNINRFISALDKIEYAWNNDYKKIIALVIGELKKEQKEFSASDIDDFSTGYCDFEEASDKATIINAKSYYKIKKNIDSLICSQYCQFLHQMASQVEAVLVKVLTANKGMKNRMSKDVLVGSMNNSGKQLDELDGYHSYDKLKKIWNFIKHNTLSAYAKLKECYGEVLISKKYEQGDLAINYLKINNKMIEEILAGLKLFFIDYCWYVYKEDVNEAEWNYEMYFILKVKIEMEENRCF